VLPFLVLFVIFYLLPIVYAMVESLTALQRTTAFAPPESVFVGLANYASVLTDPAFQASLSNLFFYALGPSTALVLLGLSLALLIDARRPGRLTALFRLTSFAPFAVPAVVGAIMWGFLYAPTTSPFLSGLAALGIHLDPLAGDPTWAIGNVAIWTFAGYDALIFLAALATIPTEVLEYARVEGASPLRVAWSIKLPMIRPTIVLIVVFTTIGVLQLFTEPMMLRSLSSSITSSWAPNMLAYSQAGAGAYSYAASVAVILAVGTAVLSFGLLRLSMRNRGS
jgi:multiple sugar transport system permease protein